MSNVHDVIVLRQFWKEIRNTLKSTEQNNWVNNGDEVGKTYIAIKERVFARDVKCSLQYLTQIADPQKVVLGLALINPLAFPSNIDILFLRR